MQNLISLKSSFYLNNLKVENMNNYVLVLWFNPGQGFITRNGYLGRQMP